MAGVAGPVRSNAGEILPLPVFPSEGKVTGSLYQHSLIENPKILFKLFWLKLKAKLLTGFIESQTKLLWN